MMLLGAILSDTVILNSPTTTERDHAVIDYLERVLALDAAEFGREMFEATSDLSDVPAEEIVARDAKEYEAAAAQTICIAQVETVGRACSSAGRAARGAGGRRAAPRLRRLALMVTDILAKGTDLW